MGRGGPGCGFVGLWDVFRFFEKPDIRFAGLPAISGLFFTASKFRFAGLPLGFSRILVQKNPVCRFTPGFSESIQLGTNFICVGELSC